MEEAVVRDISRGDLLAPLFEVVQHFRRHGEAVLQQFLIIFGADFAHALGIADLRRGAISSLIQLLLVVTCGFLLVEGGHRDLPRGHQVFWWPRNAA